MMGLMITEVAQIEIKPGSAERFEAGVRSARELFLAAPGCHSVALWKSVEQKLRYRLIVGWEKLEDHTVSFRGSEAFAKWRALVQDCFASAPQIEHQEEIPLSPPLPFPSEAIDS